MQPARTRVTTWVSEAVGHWNLTVAGGVIGEVSPSLTPFPPPSTSAPIHRCLRRRAWWWGPLPATPFTGEILTTTWAVCVCEGLAVVAAVGRSQQQPRRCSPTPLPWLLTALPTPLTDPYAHRVVQVNKGQRREINTAYMSAMRSAKIIVTCNPSSWEGDFRLWEAMASGALVFVDEMDTPMPHPLIDGHFSL